MCHTRHYTRICEKKKVQGRLVVQLWWRLWNWRVLLILKAVTLIVGYRWHEQMHEMQVHWWPNVFLKNGRSLCRSRTASQVYDLCASSKKDIVEPLNLLFPSSIKTSASCYFCIVWSVYERSSSSMRLGYGILTRLSEHQDMTLQETPAGGGTCACAAHRMLDCWNFFARTV